MTGQSEDLRGVSKKTAAAFDKFYKLLACAALIFVTAPLLYTFMSPIAGEYTLPITAVVAPAMFVAGYTVQALFGAVTKVERTPYSHAYEKLDRYFIPSKAALPLTLCVLAAYAVSSLFSHAMASGAFGLYDRASALPLFAGLLTGLFTAAGVVTWFYPYGYIVSLRSSFVYLVMLLADFVLNRVFGQSQSFLAVCFVLFLICSLVVTNQNHIISIISSSGTGIVTPRVRYYNLISVGLICLFVTLTVPIVLSIMVGATVLGRMLLLFSLRSTVGQSEEEMYMDASEQASKFSTLLFGQFDDVSPSLAKLLFFIFMLILLGTIILLIVMRRRNIIRSIINFLDALFANLMEFFANLFDFNKMSTERFVLSDYLDIETKADKEAIREYTGRQYQRPPRSYRDFLRRLEAIADPREKLVFAYNELVRCWGEKNVKIKSSDTPAEIERKVSAVTSDSHAERITRAFEYVKYAELDLPETESTMLVSLMCAQIRWAYEN